MNKPQRLNIRIKFAPQKSEAAPEETGYIYHWNRIIGASLLAVTTLTVLIYSTFDYSAQPETMAQSPKDEIKTTNPALIKESAIKPILPSSKNQKKSLVLTTVQTSEKQTQSASEPVISHNNREQKNSLALKTVKTSAKQTQSVSEPVISPSNSEQKNSISPTAEKAVPTDNSSTPLLTQSDSKIFSEQIKPFVLAQRVKDKEPIGTIDDIRLDVNNIATVYAFSKVIGLKGETLYYKWRLNGKDIAQVKVRVRSNKWRSYSRKFIQSHMQGDWSVALENSKGELLAVNRFQY